MRSVWAVLLPRPVLSNIIISLIRKLIPDQVHIPAYIVVIASLVTILEMLMNAFVPALYESLGVFVPLIVVNCIVLAVQKLLPANTRCFLRP
mgnify:CR=1 FL=1